MTRQEFRVGEPERLLERARDFDTEALGQIYDAYHPRIYRYIHARVGDGSLAEDLTGDVFAKMLESLRSGSGVKNSLSG
ncbi:MAG: sigma factor, partial [Anaerolineae bacterium]